MFRRRRLTALASAVLAAGAGAVLIVVAGNSRGSNDSGMTRRGTSAHVSTAPAALGRRASKVAPHGHLPAHVAVGLRIVSFVDRSRSIHFRDGSVGPRTLVTEIRYPAVGPAGADDVHDAPPVPGTGPYPLVVFGHGFAVTPAAYAKLLDAWARGGYIVAAPVFQLGSPLAPGGPNEADLVSWPGDLRFVISRVLAENVRAGAPLHGLIEPSRIAVAGQSDGGDTALAVAFDPAQRDRRVGAAVILSGEEIPQFGSFAFPTHGPPLLATQGSADTINLPSATQSFFSAAPRPKFLLTLLGAPHLPPYTTMQPYLGVIERVTTAFLDSYLKHQPASLHRMLTAASVKGVAAVRAER